MVEDLGLVGDELREQEVQLAVLQGIGDLAEEATDVDPAVAVVGVEDVATDALVVRVGELPRRRTLGVADDGVDR